MNFWRPPRNDGVRHYIEMGPAGACSIKKDILFQVGEIIQEAGAEFAFPSQTLYLGRDGAPVGPGAETALNEVDDWRRAKQYPFPQFPVSKLEKIEGTLQYPPHGSPDAALADEESFRDSENLSADSFEEQQEAAEHAKDQMEEPKS